MFASRLHFIVSLGILIALLAVAPLSAQNACGATLTVAAGDTLSRIAERCNVDPAELLAVNPDITNPALIYVGQVLNIPGQVDVDVPRPTVVVYPNSGPPGTPFQLIANNFPPDTDLAISIGSNTVPMEIVAMQRSTPQGALATQMIVPYTFGPADTWVVIVETADQVESDVTDNADASTAIWPASGKPGTDVQIIASGFPPNTEVLVGIGPQDGEAVALGSQFTNELGALYTQAQIPMDAASNSDWVVFVETMDEGIDAFSGIFHVLPLSDPIQPPTVTLTPNTGTPGSNVGLTASGFPPDTPVTISLGRQNEDYSVRYRTQTNGQGGINVVIQIPTFAATGEIWVGRVDAQDGLITAATNAFTVSAFPQPTPIPPAGATATPFILPTLPPATQAMFNSANTYLIAVSDNGQNGTLIGCGDSAVPVTIQFPATPAPLTAALNALFSSHQQYDANGFYNALYASTLQVSAINIVNGEAIINLTGTLQIGGECDSPRVQAQIEQTALQFSTVNRVSIFLNGTPLSTYLSGA